MKKLYEVNDIQSNLERKVSEYRSLARTKACYLKVLNMKLFRTLIDHSINVVGSYAVVVVVNFIK